MNYGRLFSLYEKELAEQGLEPESLRYLFLEWTGWSQTDFILHLNQPVSSSHETLLQEAMAELLTKRPVQYITGRAYFRDLILAVDERVLIPRPETEELVDLILTENPKAQLRVLDIGTGSGAIALSLAKHGNDWSVTASDISADALALAQQNATALGLNLHFIQSDVMANLTESLDLIVSNPPYIARSDQDEVDDNVFLHEPHLALFADEEGLAIYRKIAEQAPAVLSKEGKIYLEIGYKQGQAVAELFQTAFPTKRIRVLKDAFGKERMVVVDNG